MANMQIRRIAHELARADFAESYARAVIGVYIGGDFENKATEFLLVGLHFAFFSHNGTRRRSNFDEGIEKFLYTKVVERRTEEYRSY